MSEPIEMNGVREHTENWPVELVEKPDGAIVVRAFVGGRFDFTEVDARELIAWIGRNRPDLMQNAIHIRN